MMTLQPLMSLFTTEELTSSPEGSLAKMFPLLEIGRDSPEQEADFFSSLPEYWNSFSPNGLLSKTFRAYLPATMGETLPPSFLGWKTAGMAWRVERLTRSMPELLVQGAACSLSEVLEPTPPDDCFLTSSASANYYLTQNFAQVRSRCAWVGMGDYPLSGSGNVCLRKLTPLEQERVMGFPDNWTNLDTGR